MAKWENLLGGMFRSGRELLQTNNGFIDGTSYIKRKNSVKLQQMPVKFTVEH